MAVSASHQWNGDSHWNLSWPSSCPSPHQLQAATGFAPNSISLFCFPCCCLTDGTSAYFPREIGWSHHQSILFSNAQHRSISLPKPGWTILCVGKQNQLFQVYSREKKKNPLLIYTPTSQVSPRLVALTCDNLCPLSQSCIKLSVSPTAQNCKTDSAAS